MQYKQGLFVGRFQPLHYGHLHAINQGLKVCQKISICIGSANRNFEDNNPLTVSERIQLINLAIKNEKHFDRIEQITQCDDLPDNLQWMQLLLKNHQYPDVIISNNNLVTMLASFLEIPVFHPQLSRRELLQASIIREKIRLQQEWYKNTPEYVVTFLKEINFEQRIRQLTVKTD